MLRRRAEVADLTESLPRAVTRMRQKAERGDLFTLRMKDAGDFIRGLDRVSSRLSVSLLIAALILGTAWLIPHTSGNAFARWLTIAGFVLSALMGAWLVVSMAWRRRPGR
jgi:hypothetical protein